MEHMDDKVTYLYRHFGSEGELLYIGISLSTINRLSDHSSSSSWFNDIRTIKMETYENRKLALQAEKDAIYDEQPKHNAVHKTRVLTKPEIHSEDSSNYLIKRIVEFSSMYTIQEAAYALGIGTVTIKRYMEEGLLSYVNIMAVTKIHRYVTGWQLIDFIEYLESKEG